MAAARPDSRTGRFRIRHIRTASAASRRTVSDGRDFPVRPADRYAWLFLLSERQCWRPIYRSGRRLSLFKNVLSNFWFYRSSYIFPFLTSTRTIKSSINSPNPATPRIHAVFLLCFRLSARISSSVNGGFPFTRL